MSADSLHPASTFLASLTGAWGSGALEEFAPEKEAHLTTCSFAAPEIPNQRLSMLLARAPPFGCFFRRALCVSRRQLIVFYLLPFGGGITGVGSPAPYGRPIYCLP